MSTSFATRSSGSGYSVHVSERHVRSGRGLLLLALLAAGCERPALPEAPAVRFADVTGRAGLSGFQHNNGSFGRLWEPEIMGAGVAFIDYDGDGWQDVLLVGGGSFREADDADHPALFLYRNQQDGTFELVNEETGLAAVRTFGMGVAVADYDNDGDPDFLLTTTYENLLFRNDGQGTTRRFTEVGAEAGLGAVREWSTSALFFDADRDGWLDLFVANYLDWSPETDVDCVGPQSAGYCTPEASPGTGNRFFQNNGDGTFTDRTHEAGFADAINPVRNKALGVAEHDFNRDGWPDLYVGNDTERDLLYVNQGDGTFRERGVELAVAYSPRGKARAGMGVDAGVVDTTGRITLFVGNFSREAVGVYRYSGLGFFEERAEVAQLTAGTLRTLTFGLFLFDPDLDGDLDLFLSNGHLQSYIHEVSEGVTFQQPPQLFLNDGNGRFTDASRGTMPFTDRLVGRGAAYADYDRDGDVDVLIAENNGPVRLWRNEQTSGQSVRIRLRGAPPVNYDAYGSVVTGWIGGRALERRVHGGSSYLSHSETTVTFGLGGAAALDSVDVQWPDGVTQRFGRIDAGQDIEVRRDASVATSTASEPD